MNMVLSTTHSTAFHIKGNPYQPHSAEKKFHNIKLKLPTYSPDPALLTVSAYCIQFLHTTVSIYQPCSVYSNYIASTHNITHSPCTSTCTTHPTILSQLPSTTLLCTQLTNSGTRCRDGVNVLQCRSHLVWLVFEGSIPTSACFHSEDFFVTCLMADSDKSCYYVCTHMVCVPYCSLRLAPQ